MVVARQLSARCGGRILLSLAVVGSILSDGCAGMSASMDGGGPRLDRGRQGRDIARVVCFYSPTMWQSFDAGGDRNAEGFAFVMYLVSQESRKEGFADGVVNVKLFQIDRTPDGGVNRTLAQEWTADTSVLPKREPHKLGCSYQPSLYWGDLDVYGKEVEIVVQYESPDGSVVRGQTHHTFVPSRKA